MITGPGMQSKDIPLEHKKNSISGKKSLEIPKGLFPLNEFSGTDLKEQIKNFNSHELKKHADTKSFLDKTDASNFPIKWNFTKLGTASTKNQNKTSLSKDNLPKWNKMPSNLQQSEKMNNLESQTSSNHKANRLSLQDINFKENDKYRKGCSNMPSIVIKITEPSQEKDCHTFLSVQHSPIGSILLSPTSCTDSKTDISALLRLSLEKQLRKNNLSVSNANSIKDIEYFPSDLVSKLEDKKRIIEKSEDLISKYTKGKKAEKEKSYYTRGSGYPSIAPSPQCSSLIHIDEPEKQENYEVMKPQTSPSPQKPYNLNQEKTSLDNSPQGCLLNNNDQTGESIFNIVPHQVEDDQFKKCCENDIIIQEDAQMAIEVEKAEIEKEGETQQIDNMSVGSTRLETNQVVQTRETNFDSLKTGFSTIASEILDREIDPYSIKSLENLETCHEQEQDILIQTYENQTPQEDFAFEKTIRENCEKKRFSIHYELDEKVDLEMSQLNNPDNMRKNQEPFHFSELMTPADQPSTLMQFDRPLETEDSEAKEATIISHQNPIPDTLGLTDPLAQGSLGDNEVFNSLSHIYQQSLENVSLQEIKEKSQIDLHSNIKVPNCQEEEKKLNFAEFSALKQEDQQKGDKASKSKKQKEVVASSQVFTFANTLDSESQKTDLLEGYRKRSASQHNLIGDDNILFGKNNVFQNKDSGKTQSELESNHRRSLFKPNSIDICTNQKHSEGSNTYEEIGCSLSSLNESTKKSICKQSTAKLTPLRIALDPLCTPGKSKDIKVKGSLIRTANSQDLSDKLSQLDSLCSECDSQAGPREEYYFLFEENLDFESPVPESDPSAPIQEDFTKDLGQTLAEAPSLMLRPNDLTRKDSHYDKFFAIYSENVSRVETFKKFGQHQAAIRLLEEILEEFEMEDDEDEDFSNKKDSAEISETPKDMINLRYYKIQLYNMLSLELYENGRYEEALTYAKKVLKIDRYNLQALYKSYQANAKLKNDDEARSILKRVRKLTQLQSFSQSQQNLKLDNISIPSQLSSLTNGSFCEGLQNMSFHSKLQGAVTKIWSKFKLNQLSNKIDESST